MSRHRGDHNNPPPTSQSSSSIPKSSRFCNSERDNYGMIPLCETEAATSASNPGCAR